MRMTSSLAHERLCAGKGENMASSSLPLVDEKAFMPGDNRNQLRALRVASTEQSPRLPFTKLALVLVAFVYFFVTRDGRGFLDAQIQRHLVHPAARSLWHSAAFTSHMVDGEDDICPQVEPWSPPKSTDAIPAPPRRETLAKLLSGAVQVDTSVYDDFPLPVASDPALWERVYGPFQRYLERAFPEIHSAPHVISREIVNSHGLLYTWKGKNQDLKPIIFMAHQDVVPVEPSTIDKWTHAPFSGYIDLKNDLVFGRGASDDKASLVSLMAAITSLLKSGFEPERTIVLSFGFDEEASGTQGARPLAQRLGEIYGSHREGQGAFMVVDEGAGLDATTYGIPVAAPAVAEKGYVDIRITVKTPGGHSSQPPKHTAIGLLSRVIARIEDQPWYPTLSIREDALQRRANELSDQREEDNPGLETLLCVYDAPKMRSTELGKRVRQFVTARKRASRMKKVTGDGWWLKASKQHLLKRAQSDIFLARHLVLNAIAKSDIAYQFQTTQAVDIIAGGVKINALPERATALVNHRINVEENVVVVHEHLQRVVCPIAQKYGLSMQAWGSKLTSCPNHDHHLLENSTLGTVILEDAFDSPLPSAPRTPTRGTDAGPYRLLSSVIRHTWDGHASSEALTPNSPDAQASLAAAQSAPVRVTPSVMTGNTDTQRYWNLTQHIFRFAPMTLKPVLDPRIRPDHGIHTVDEVVQIDTLTMATTFYTTMMVAAQQAL